MHFWAFLSFLQRFLNIFFIIIKNINFVLNFKIYIMFKDCENKKDVLIKLISGEIPYGDNIIKCTQKERELIKSGLVAYMVAYKKKYNMPLTDKLFSYPSMGPDMVLHWVDHTVLNPEDVFKNKSTGEFIKIMKLKPGESYRVEKADASTINVLKGMCCQKKKGEFSFKTEYPTTVVVTRLLEPKVSIRGELSDLMNSIKEGENTFFWCLERNMPTVRAMQGEVRKKGISISVSAYTDGGCYITRNRNIVNMDKFPMIKHIIDNENNREFTCTQDQYEDFIVEISKLKNRMLSCLVNDNSEEDDDETL